MITTTALVHPVMIAKLRLAMQYAISGHGELMGGHSHRCYIANRHGHNIMRVSWSPLEKEFTVWAGCTKNFGSQVITDRVKRALMLAN